MFGWRHRIPPANQWPRRAGVGMPSDAKNSFSASRSCETSSAAAAGRPARARRASGRFPSARSRTRTSPHRRLSPVRRATESRRTRRGYASRLERHTDRQTDRERWSVLRADSPPARSSARVVRRRECRHAWWGRSASSYHTMTLYLRPPSTGSFRWQHRSRSSSSAHPATSRRASSSPRSSTSSRRAACQPRCRCSASRGTPYTDDAFRTHLVEKARETLAAGNRSTRRSGPSSRSASITSPPT